MKSYEINMIVPLSPSMYDRERIKKTPEELVLWYEVESVCRAVFVDARIKSSVGRFYMM